eukprot:CAMPEP_0179251250 /NCGR_PEP_ID=MMETSP0797-20121207/21589_1 /TAXON_ID=47934 /ORGANISM="Dinophysis acuminata, Strain DAEP01" /LENGTH=742 /DNA_ID=CAMNT_0020959017 /DNA_START=22 /DNA_END=2250 /DNA_ORIENTATION=-
MEQDSLYFSDVVELQRLALAHAEHNMELQETVDRMKRAEFGYLSRIAELQGQGGDAGHALLPSAKEIQELQEVAMGYAQRSNELEAQVQALEQTERDQQMLISHLQQAGGTGQEASEHVGRIEGLEDRLAVHMQRNRELEASIEEMRRVEQDCLAEVAELRRQVHASEGAPQLAPGLDWALRAENAELQAKFRADVEQMEAAAAFREQRNAELEDTLEGMRVTLCERNLQVALLEHAAVEGTPEGRQGQQTTDFDEEGSQFDPMLLAQAVRERDVRLAQLEQTISSMSACEEDLRSQCDGLNQALRDRDLRIADLEQVAASMDHRQLAHMHAELQAAVGAQLQRNARLEASIHQMTEHKVPVPDAAPEPRQCSTNFGATSLTMCGAHPAPKLRSDAKLVEVHGARCEANAVSSPCKWADASLVEVHGASPNQCLDAKLVEAQRGKADANAIQRASLDAKAVDVPRLQVPERWLDANAAQRQPPEARLVEVHGARCEAKTLAPPGQRLDAKLAENHGAWCDARTSASPGKALVSPPKPRLDVGSPGEVHGAGCEAHPVRSYWPDARLAEAHGQHEGDTRGAFNVSTPGFEFSSMQSPPRHHAVGTTCTSSHMMDLSVRSVALPPGAPLPPGASPAQALDSTVRTVPHAAPPQEVPIYVQPRAKPRVLPGAPPSHHAADPPRVALSAVGAGIRRTSPQPQPPGDPQRRLSAARISAAAVSLPTHAPHPAAKLYSPRSSLGRSGL